MKKSLQIYCFFLLIVLLGCKKNNAVETETVPDNGAIENVKTVRLTATFSLAEGGQVLPAFADTVKKAQELLEKVFSSKEFRDSMYLHNYADSAYSKSTKGCFDEIYKGKNGAISGEAVYNNLVAGLAINLAITIKDNGTNTTTLGSSSACIYKITTYDYWLTANQNLAYRLARHIAHEFTHIRGYRHDANVTAGFEWGSSINKDPAYGVGNVVGNILTRWNKVGLIKL